MQSKKHEALTIEKKKDLEQLKGRRDDLAKTYTVRVTEMRQKALQIRDLVERAKAEADGGLTDVLNKWEAANEHILKKYPDPDQMDFSLLEKGGEIGNDGEKGQQIH